MPTDSLKATITGELRALRKLPGRLDESKLTRARAILMAFGGADPSVALKRLVDLAQEQSGDREIEAAMASLGWGTSRETSLDRLVEFSEIHYVDPRTVRRWSDAGIQKLALLILGKTPWTQPRARLVVVVVGDEVRVGLDLRIPPRLRMGTPSLRVGGEIVEVFSPEIERSDQDQRLRTQLETLGKTSLLPLRLRLSWSGEKIPIYEAVTRGDPNIYFNARHVFTGLAVTVSRWSPR